MHRSSDVHDDAPRDSSISWDVVRLDVRYDNTAKNRLWLPIRWDAFDRIAASFDRLELVVMSFKRYLDGSQGYVAEALAQMPHLTADGRVHVEWRDDWYVQE